MTKIYGISLAIWVLYYFNASPLYAQLLLFNEKKFSDSILVVIWVALLGVALVYRRRVTIGWPQLSLFAFVAYSTVMTIVHCVESMGVVRQLGMSGLGSILLHIALAMVLLLYTGIGGLAKDKFVTYCLVIAMVPLLFWGGWQVLFGYSHITMTVFSEFMGRAPYGRAFGLFTEAVSYGWYMALIAIVMVFALIDARRPSKRIAFFVFLMLALAGNLVSLTRTSVMTLGFCFLFVLMYKSERGRNKLSLYSPLIFAVIALFVFIYASDLHDLLGGFFGQFANSTSTFRRQQELLFYVHMMREYGVSKILFGLGPLSSVIPSNAHMWIDNSYIYMLTHYGVVGVGAWLWLSIVLWRDMYLRNLMRPTPLRTAVVAFWSTWMGVSLFATAIDTYFLLAILFYMSAPRVPTDRDYDLSFVVGGRREVSGM